MPEATAHPLRDTTIELRDFEPLRIAFAIGALALGLLIGLL